MTTPSVSDILREGATTFEERNAVYGSNYMNVGNVMKALFPNGVKLQAAEDFLVWHIFELIIVKLTRLACSELRHEDSIRDAMVYSAMLEKLIKERNNGAQ